jgi:hypothetical protein
VAAYLASDPFVLGPKFRGVVADLLDELDERAATIEGLGADLVVEQRTVASLDRSLVELRAGDIRIHDPRERP